MQELCETRDKSVEDEHVIIFTHGLLILFLFQYLLSKPDEFILKNFEKKDAYAIIPNTATTKFKIHKMVDGKRRLEFFHVHDVSHLTDPSLRS